ncbi:hypothetical protein Ocin01_14805 [Orchesella cincta]|uniref:Uncharacterized protein n=1 Tax=Orchesella cincta TaxID=48709 RepID=A0A1D2MFW2_ORCCI|nr:hypothetical protein Ocin01_14805 [Orchesella cincta]
MNQTSKIPKDVSKSMLQNVVNAGKFLGMSMRDLSVQRRQSFKSSLSMDLAPICDNHNVMSEFLFGDNLETQIKASRANSKILRLDYSAKRVGFSSYNRVSHRPMPSRGHPPRFSQSLNFQQPPRRRGSPNYRARGKSFAQQ